MEPPVAHQTRPKTYQRTFLCRTCNVTSPNCLPLFKELLIGGKITTPAKVLIYCTDLKILEADHYLPQHICPECMVKMQSSLQFKQSVHQMDRLLRQRYFDLRPQSTSKSTKDSRLSPQNGEQANEENFCVLIEQHLEEKMEENRERTEGELEDSQITDEQREKQEMQQLEQQAEGAEPKNWIEIEEAEAELIEEDLILFKIIEESEDAEDPPIVVGSDLPKPANNSKSHRRQTPNHTLQCQICGKQLSTTNSFKYHMQLHGTATPYVCHICCESFKTRNALDGHVTVHDPNNPNRCPTCDKVYRQPSSLRSHLLTHSGIKPFKCSICGKRLTQRSGYKKHLLTHTGEKPHVCDICGRTFRYSSNLIVHKRCHSQDKPHQCHVCQKRSFGSISELNRHMLVHSSERPFGCGECGKSYKRQVSLSQHQQSHKADHEET